MKIKSKLCRRNVPLDKPQLWVMIVVDETRREWMCTLIHNTSWGPFNDGKYGVYSGLNGECLIIRLFKLQMVCMLKHSESQITTKRLAV